VTLTSPALPTDTLDRVYDPATGQLASLAGPGSETVAFDWDGFLLESESWSGPVAGTVSFGYVQPGLRLASETLARRAPHLGRSHAAYRSLESWPPPADDSR
jgi:hypothetical protein